MFDNASITWGAAQLAAMVKNERIVFDSIVQRSYVWEKQRKSLFVHSMAAGFPIPPTYAKRYDDGSGQRNCNVYSMLDGKQRLSTIKQFLNDEFELTELEPVTYFDEMTNQEEVFDMTGKKYSELPEGLREKIKNARINVIYFDDLTAEEEKELFKRLNNGKPLTSKNKCLASCVDLESLLEITRVDLFEDMLSRKALENKTQVIIAMKIWAMMYRTVDNVSFLAKDFNALLETTTVTPEQAKEMDDVFTYIMNVHTLLAGAGNKRLAKIVYTETHMVSLVPYVVDAISKDVSEESFIAFISKFYDNEGDDTKKSCSREYDNAVIHGSARTDSIITRDDELRSVYEEMRF